MLDRNEIETRIHDMDEAEAERDFERKLCEFRSDPYGYCDWAIDWDDHGLMGALLDLALAHPDALALFDMEAAVAHRVDQKSIDAVQELLLDSVARIET